MTILFVVLPLAVLLSSLAAMAFAWATRAGQFDDLETPAVRLLSDELPEPAPDRTGKRNERISSILPEEQPPSSRDRPPWGATGRTDPL
jgi:cbb3-type cytochrome oxidase maturation protein